VIRLALNRTKWTHKKEILRDVKIKSVDFKEYFATMLESGMVETKIVKRGGKGRDSVWVVLLDQGKVGNVTNVAKVAKVAKVERDYSIERKDSTLATLATMDILPSMAPKGKESQGIGPHPHKDMPTREEHIRTPDLAGMSAEEIITAGLKHGLEEAEKKPVDPGFQKFKAGLKKRHCLKCGRDFSYDLGIHFLDGYICTPCSMGHPPPQNKTTTSSSASEPVHSDLQKTLDGEVPA
jgi:hypothetical protein